MNLSIWPSFLYWNKFKFERNLWRRLKTFIVLFKYTNKSINNTDFCSEPVFLIFSRRYESANKILKGNNPLSIYICNNRINFRNVLSKTDILICYQWNFHITTCSTHLTWVNSYVLLLYLFLPFAIPVDMLCLIFDWNLKLV